MATPPEAFDEAQTPKREAGPRSPQLFHHLPDDTAAATSSFEVIPDCIYGNKYMASSDQEALGCECSEEWGESAAYGEKGNYPCDPARTWS
jgi:histone-lysine N-methyltransferase SETD2